MFATSIWWTFTRWRQARCLLQVKLCEPCLSALKWFVYHARRYTICHSTSRLQNLCLSSAVASRLISLSAAFTTPLLLSCPRSDCVIPDTLIVFVTYLLTYLQVLYFIFNFFYVDNVQKQSMADMKTWLVTWCRAESHGWDTEWCKSTHGCTQTAVEGRRSWTHSSIASPSHRHTPSLCLLT